jgi:hypothetical protein
MLVLCLPLFITSLFPHTIRMPVRISSIPHRQPLPPLGYVFVEDIIAVDGGGGSTFRQGWRARYEASLPVRRLVRHLSLLWGITGVLIGAALIAAALIVPSVDVGYGVGYGIPWLWGLTLAVFTWGWARKEFVKEGREWKVQVPKEHPLPMKGGSSARNSMTESSHPLREATIQV